MEDAENKGLESVADEVEGEVLSGDGEEEQDHDTAGKKKKKKKVKKMVRKNAEGPFVLDEAAIDC